MALSLEAESAARPRHRAPDESATCIEHVAVGYTVYRVRGELIERGARPPVVLVVAERDPHALPSNRELMAAYRLTPAEARVALLVAVELSSREIARELGVTVSTARKHTAQVLRKLGVSQRIGVLHELLQLARRSAGALRRARSLAAVADEIADEVADVGTPREERDAGQPASRGAKERVVAYIANEHDRQALARAVQGEMELQFAERPHDLRAPWNGGIPSAVLVELTGGAGEELETALAQLRLGEPTIPIWGYAHVEHNSMLDVSRLAGRGLIAEIITVHNDIPAQMRRLLSASRKTSEAAALRRVWELWVQGGALDLVLACIDASATARTVRELAHRLKRSTRTLRWQTSRLGLPSPQRILRLCRLMRAMHRLDGRGNVKIAVRDLGYPSVHALAIQLQRHTGLHLSDRREGGNFAEVARYVEAEVLATREGGTRRGESVRQRRERRAK